MAKKESSKENTKKSAASASTKATSVVTANPRLVAALKSYQTSLDQAKSYLVDVATIVQEEQLTKNEIVASLMEARGIEKSSAESQYSRMKGILTNPEVLEKLRSGEMDLKTARSATTKKQSSPSQSKQQDNADKRFAKGVTTLITAAKELGMDKASVLNAIKVACRKNGII